MKTLLIRNIKLNKIEWASVVDRGASGDANNRPRIVLWKRDEKKTLGERVKAALGLSKATKPAAVPCEKQEATPMDPTLELALDQLKLNDEQKAAVLKMLAAAKGETAKPEEPKKPEGDETPEAPAAMPPELKKRFDEETAARVELEKSNKALADKLATIEFEKKATELSFLPEKTETIAQILKRAADRGDKELPELLAKANKAMKESPLFKTYGTSQTGTEDPQAKLQTIAKKYREENPKMTAAEAQKRAARENPDLYAQARKGE